jgi:hypothetical protein
MSGRGGDTMKAKRNSRPKLIPNHIEAAFQRMATTRGHKISNVDMHTVFEWTVSTLTPDGRSKLFFYLLEMGYGAEKAKFKSAA